MKKMKTGLLLLALFLVISMACSFTGNIFGNSGKISTISFCSDVTDEGECVDKGNSFPPGTSSVYAYFTYEGMKDGQKWSRIWTQDGDLYDETRDEAWDNGAQGWVAYSVDDPNGLAGEFTLEILVGKNQVQKASFTVKKENASQSGKTESGQASFPAFGPITIAEDAADNAFPIEPAKVFNYGVSKVVGVFAYSNMTPEMTYTAEWLRDGQTLARKEYPWEDTANGMHYTSLSDDTPLLAGKYTLNLYLQGELVRTTNFQIIDKQQPQPAEPAGGTSANTNPRPNRPATPEEVVDADALKYFYMISDANLPVLNQVVKDNLAGWTKIKVVDSNPCGANALACFVKEACDQRWGGTVYLPRAEMAGVSDVQITATLTHELTHGMEFYGGMRCGCSVQKEFYAMAAEMDYVYYSGNIDTFNADYGGVWDANGKVDTGKLWNIVKEVYSGKCPEY
ncbi:hypothetical protein hrd7_08010 [Leptolinea sp. HRD-7]|nr:hypothetical protein hrd7_08010 [Leptolinea sp. HRD-7]